MPPGEGWSCFTEEETETGGWLPGSGHAVLERGAYKAPTVCSSLCRGWSAVFTSLGMGKALPQAGEKWPAPGSQHLEAGAVPLPLVTPAVPTGTAGTWVQPPQGPSTDALGAGGAVSWPSNTPWPWACGGGQVLAHPRGTPPPCDSRALQSLQTGGGTGHRGPQVLRSGGPS